MTNLFAALGQTVIHRLLSNAITRIYGPPINMPGVWTNLGSHHIFGRYIKPLGLLTELVIGKFGQKVILYSYKESVLQKKAASTEMTIVTSTYSWKFLRS